MTDSKPHEQPGKSDGFTGPGTRREARDGRTRGEAPPDPIAVLRRIQVLQALACWKAGAELGEAAIQDHSDCGLLYLMTAFCVQQYRGAESAHAILLSGEEVLKRTAFFHYSVACCEDQLGNQAEAKFRFATASEIDPAYRAKPLIAPTLRELWDFVSACIKEETPRN